MIWENRRPRARRAAIPMPSLPSISIIMPTEARPERALSLRRALDSARSQRGVQVIPIVVANGRATHPTVLAEIGRLPDVDLVRLEVADLPEALRTGRDRVRSPFFAELDDDDELLPGALATRLDALRSRPDVDAVVTQGFVDRGGPRELNIPDIEALQSDPLRALFDQNWLAPCAGLFRSATIGREFFAAVPPYLEWTYLALRVALERRVLFLNQPTWIYRAETPGSLTKTRDYVLGQPAALRRLLTLPLPMDVRRRLRGRQSAMLHSAAELERRDGNQGAAWRWHLETLAAPGGWRYALYTRRLLAALFRPAADRAGC